MLSSCIEELAFDDSSSGQALGSRTKAFPERLLMSMWPVFTSEACQNLACRDAAGDCSFVVSIA